MTVLEFAMIGFFLGYGVQHFWPKKMIGDIVAILAIAISIILIFWGDILI